MSSASASVTWGAITPLILKSRFGMTIGGGYPEQDLVPTTHSVSRSYYCDCPQDWETAPLHGRVPHFVLFHLIQGKNVQYIFGKLFPKGPTSINCTFEKTLGFCTRRTLARRHLWDALALQDAQLVRHVIVPFPYFRHTCLLRFIFAFNWSFTMTSALKQNR